MLVVELILGEYFVILCHQEVERGGSVAYGGPLASYLHQPVTETPSAAICEVCFDSTFPHFRVKMKGAYEQRRQRMQELMTKEFTKIGFPSMMLGRRKNPDLVGGFVFFFWGGGVDKKKCWCFVLCCCWFLEGQG